MNTHLPLIPRILAWISIPALALSASVALAKESLKPVQDQMTKSFSSLSKVA